MKKNFMIMALASVLMMPVSCTKEMEAPQEPSANHGFDLVEMTFDAVTEGGKTKTTIDLSDGSVAWTAGDAVKFVWELAKEVGSSVSEGLTEGDITKETASFTAEVPSDFIKETSDYSSRHLYAVYPATIDTDYSKATDLFVTVPAEQDGTFANASIALAKWDKEAPTAPLQFMNLCGLLQIIIDDEAARKVVISSSTEIVGKTSVTFKTTGPQLKENENNALTKEVTVNITEPGTYYVAVLPGTLEDVYVSIYDESGNLIGDRVANNAIPVARKQIRKLGTIGTGFSDRYYVKVDGTGNGSSWDNAAGLSDLKTLVASNTVKNVYIAAGTYNFGGSNFTSNADAAAKFSVYGGYPADATGYSIANRDVVNNATIFDGGRTETTTADKRIWVIQKGTFLINGIIFQNAYRASKADIGSAVILEGAVNVTFTDCVFQNNTNLQTPKEGTLGGGALRLANFSVSEFNNCKFLNNTTDYDGGAAHVSASAKVTFNGCEFSGNTATHDGGAVYQTGSTEVEFNACEFYSNSARYGSVISTIAKTTMDGCIVGAAEKANVAARGAICLNASAVGTLLIENSDISYNEAKMGGAIYVDNLGATSALDVKNTKFTYNNATEITVANGGGAIAVSGGSRSYTDLLNFSDVLFENNSAVGSGGAVWSNGAGLSFTDCSFISNKSTTGSGASGSGGGAVYGGSSSSPATRFFFNRCYFNANDVSTGSWGRHLSLPGTQTYLGMNNCLVRGPFVPTYAPNIANGAKGTGAGIASKGGAVIVNTTMLCQMAAPMIARGSTSADRGYSIINSIVLNVAGTPYSFAMSSTSEYMNIYSCIYTNHYADLSEKYTIDDKSLGGVTKTDTQLLEFGWTYQEQGTIYNVPAPRNSIRVFDWNGVLSNGKTFTNQSYDTISGIITKTAGVGPAFMEWLNNGAELKNDIRGKARNTSAMWPGSYEEYTAAANAENLNVK